MTTLNLQSKKVNQATANEIAAFVYENRNALSIELKMFYQDVKGFIEMQVKKPVSHRMNMQQILDRSYNIEQYILNSGAAAVTTEFI
jgi:hypothetical protein